MFPGSTKKTKVSDEVRFDKLNHWISKAKQHYIFVKNVMLLYTKNVLRDSMDSDRFTE